MNQLFLVLHLLYLLLFTLVSSLPRSLHSAAQDDLLCSTGHSLGEGSAVDEGALMSQLYTALKDFDGIEELDRALGIPALIEQVRSIILCHHIHWCWFQVTFLYFLLWLYIILFCLSISDPVTGAGAVPPGPLHDVGAEAPHVHPAIWAPPIPHGPKGLSWFAHARARLPSHVCPDGSKAELPHNEDAGPTRTQARQCPQPA